MSDPERALDRFRLDDRVVIVTGASGGLGERFARVVTGVGASVVLAARRIDRLEMLAADLPDALAVECDITSLDGPQHLIDAVNGPDFKVWPMINVKRDALPGADDVQDEEGKIAAFDPTPYEE